MTGVTVGVYQHFVGFLTSGDPNENCGIRKCCSCDTRDEQLLRCNDRGEPSVQRTVV